MSEKHDWQCVSPGMYDSTYQCRRCGQKNVESIDNPAKDNPVYGCPGNKQEKGMSDTIQLTKAETQSGLDRVRWAELLILQLPESHDGRNSWLLNYGTGGEAQEIQFAWALRLFGRVKIDYFQEEG